MSIFSSFNINASGLTAQRYRMDVISENVANANTTRTADGTPYRRKVVTFAEKGGQTPFGKVLGSAAKEYDNLGSLNCISNNGCITSRGHVSTHGYSGQGVKVNGVFEDNETPMNVVYDPSHPDADENGYVTYPNVNIVMEMTNLIDASRAYEANATAFGASKSMALKGLEIAQK